MTNKKTTDASSKTVSNIEKQVIKTDSKINEVIQDVTEIKETTSLISTHISEIQKTLAVQSTQLGEHMRRTDALEKLVSQNKQAMDINDFNAATRLTVLETSKTETEKHQHQLRKRDIAIIGIVMGVIQLILKFVGG